MDADAIKRPICRVLVLRHVSSGGMHAYHPVVAPLSIHQPPRDLARSLDDEQTAEALSDLKDGCAVPQQFVPSANRHHLHQSIHAKQPVVHARVLRPLSAKSALHPSRIVVRVDGEFVQTPDQHGGDHEPLCDGKDVT